MSHPIGARLPPAVRAGLTNAATYAWRPLTASALIVSALRSSPVYSHSQPQWLWPTMLALPIAVGALALCAAFLGGASRARPLTRSDLTIIGALGLIVVLALVTVPFSLAPARSWQQGVALALFTAFLALTYIARWGDRRTLIGDLATVFVVTLVVQAVGLVLAISGQEWTFAGVGGRFRGVLDNSNYAGMLSTVGAALGVCLLVTVTGRIARVGIAAGVAVLLVPLVLSNSRGSMIAFAGGVLAVLAVKRAWKPLIAFAIAACLVIAAFVMFPGLAHRDNSPDFTSGRVEVWEAMLDHWRRTPVIGTGYRTVEVLRGTDGLSGHNLFIWILTELGLIGLILLLALLAAHVVRGRLNAFLGGAICVILVEQTESTMYAWSGAGALTFWLVLLAYPAFARAAPEAPAG